MFLSLVVWSQYNKIMQKKIGEDQKGNDKEGLLRRLQHGWVDEVLHSTQTNSPDKFVSFFQDRGRRQLSDRFEGDIILDSPGSDPSLMSAALANSDKMWPSGRVEYQFYHTIPRSSNTYLHF